METLNQEEDELIPEYLSRLEKDVLSELSLREKNYSFRFNGLRRILKDVHQQKLSRALERLQEDQLIERYPDGGYGLDSNSYELIRDYYNKQQMFLDYSNLNSSNKQELTVFSTDRDFPVKSIINKLAGKYFGDFRFIGHYYSNGKGRLEWIHAEDRSKILISSITASKIEIMAFNVSKAAINKFLHIIQEFLLDYQILVNFSDTATSMAN
ncbi:MAG: hypothetical protein JSU57_03580 [Candidatus Heimdallarchaeota archaeon]|nr:MAG: hypothetical protein JSU57_03580 [Candidatus Heimdallarchaeota archaeon]